MGLHELTNCSLATRAMSSADLTALLDEARETNLRRGIIDWSMGKKFLRLHRTAFLRQQTQPDGAR